MVEAQGMVVQPKTTDSRFDLREYLPLVAHAVAEKAAHVTDDLKNEALTCAGMLGLLEATVTAPSSDGGSFGGYALRRVRQAVGEELAEVAWSERAAVRNIIVAAHIARVLPNGLTATPTPAEAAACLRLRLADVRALINDVSDCAISIDRVLFGSPGDYRTSGSDGSVKASRRPGYYADVAASAVRGANEADAPELGPSRTATQTVS